jgi:GT2 family glycosyltransferase
MGALSAIGGFRESLIAGEEPELCVRLRSAGWRIWRLDADMALHDAAMTRFSQWWRRMQRGGYAFAQGAYLHGAPPERHCVWEARRARLWGLWLPLACLLCGLVLGPWGWLAFSIFPLHILQKTLRLPGTFRERLLLAFFHVLGHVAESFGQLRFLRDRLRGGQSRIIEYK